MDVDAIKVCLPFMLLLNTWKATFPVSLCSHQGLVTKFSNHVHNTSGLSLKPLSYPPFSQHHLSPVNHAGLETLLWRQPQETNTNNVWPTTQEEPGSWVTAQSWIPLPPLVTLNLSLLCGMWKKYSFTVGGHWDEMVSAWRSKAYQLWLL